MVLLVLAAVGGFVAGRARRPAGGHGARPHVRHLELVVVGIGLALAATAASGDVSVVLDALSIATLAGFSGVNRSVTGIAVMGVGLVLNLAAVVLNNGMPVRGESLVRAGVVRSGELSRHDVAAPRHLESDADAFGWLGTVVPIPGVRTVASFGDLILLVGLADAARELGRRRMRVPTVTDDVPWPPGALPSAQSAPGAGTRGAAFPPDTTAANVDHDWGDAPSGAPESGSQCSAKPEVSAADASDFWRDAALPPSPAHLAPNHDR